ncbi:MAG: WYL domain-containing protein [Leptolyngbya sp. SIOISBB]|nr:WYL domain-containing protein [Leptolyngbya sp. SIOISBB]
MVDKAEPLPLICHCLIGPPGAGKSTLAQQWVKRSPHYQWISTDHIRQDLFGDAATQGNWPQVEAEVIRQIKAAIANDTPVIYDATNAKRVWRLDLMQKLADRSTQWMAWWLKTPLQQCKAYNQRRDRQVEARVIDEMHAAIKAMPPIPAEGFAAVNPVPMRQTQFDFGAIEHKIQTLPQSLLQRQRRQANCQLHPYSSLLAFEQLLYLIAILLEYPGAGHLQQREPSLLQQALQLEELSDFDSPVAEISALIQGKYGALYAETEAIERNLQWLRANHIVNAPYTTQPISVPEVAGPATFALHRYSDRDVFTRLISTLRFIAHHPFLYAPEQGSLKTLIAAMEAQGAIATGYTDSVRRDMGEVLKPYGLMSQLSQTQGYFVGTAILSKPDLLRIFNSLIGQVQYLDDPVLLSTHMAFRERLKFLQLDEMPNLPVRAVLQQPIVNAQQLPPNSDSLAAPGNAERLEEAILQSQVLTLKRRRGTGRFSSEDETTFQVLPLQIAFNNIAWYLGYERLADNLLRYERLDRLEIVQDAGFSRPRSSQDKARRRLKKLYEASYGVYLGNSAIEQQKFLSPDPEQRAEVTVNCELWFNDAIFRFISEGTQRFPCQMSPRLPDAVMTESEKTSIFTLPKTGNPVFPNRLKADFPRWILTDDVDFKRWILGFGGQVRVVAPEFLANKIKEVGKEIWQAYSIAHL